MSELCAAIPAAIFLNENLERAVDTYLPAGDSLSTTLSSPQFSQALSMFWSALQSGQVAPVIQQFGLGDKAVTAAADGNIDNFVCALETETTSQSNTYDASHNSVPDPDTEDNNTEISEARQQSSKKTENEKKDDDDEGMALH